MKGNFEPTTDDEILILKKELEAVKLKSEQRKQQLQIHCETQAKHWMADGSVFYGEGKAIMDAIGDD